MNLRADKLGLRSSPEGREELGRIARFCAVGGSGLVVNILVFWPLTRAGVASGLAATAAFALAVLNNYGWNRLWTFRAQRAAIIGQGLRFAVVAVLSLCTNLAFLHLLVASGVRPVYAQGVAIVLVTPLNYLGNRMWSFNESVSIRRRLGEERFSAYRRILVWGILSRVVVFTTALVSWQTHWLEPAGWARQQHDPLAVLNAWDGRWYRIVAQRGYVDIPHHQSDTAFFPLYPVLIKLLHGLGFSFSGAALVLANVGFILALGALYELARIWLPAAFAERTAVYAALFPLGFVFSMSYPEGLVLAAMAGAGVCASRGRWTFAAVLAAAATLARPEGLFIALPIAAVLFRRRHEIDARERSSALAAVAAAPAALASVMAYEQLTVGSALAFSQAQKEWGRRFSPTGVVRALHELMQVHGPNQWLWRDAAFCAVYVVLLLVAMRIGVPKSWIAMGALIVLLPLESGSFTSIGRFGLLALPVYAGLARFGQRRFVDLGLRVGMLGVLGLGTATVLMRWP